MPTILVFLFWCILIGAVIYLLMIMPRMVHKADPTPFQKALYAHRGLHNNQTDAPENSMKAFQKAVKSGYGIEMDIQLSKDNVPVVFHDFTLERVCGVKGKVSDYTYEQLQQFLLCHSRERIPRLTDVLKLVDGKVPLIIEFKIERFDLALCKVADQILREYKGLYCMESFNPLGVFWYRRNHKEIMRGQLSDAFHREGIYKGPLYFVLENLLFNFLTQPDFIAFNHKYPRMLSRSIVHRLYGNTAAAWTIKNQQELEKAKRYFDIFIFDSFIPDHGSLV